MGRRVAQPRSSFTTPREQVEARRISWLAFLRAATLQLGLLDQ